MRTARTDLLFMRASASKEDGVETLAPRLAPVTRRGTIQGPGASPTLEAPRIRQVAARHALTGQGCAGCVGGDGHRRQGQSRGGPLDAPLSTGGVLLVPMSRLGPLFPRTRMLKAPSRHTLPGCERRLAADSRKRPFAAAQADCGADNERASDGGGQEGAPFSCSTRNLGRATVFARRHAAFEARHYDTHTFLMDLICLARP
ncbi:hypothetical protein VFPFJ_00256 [Purpureocillium lilacinum]|uniref:Uncharacterized protein n=1 Tax=Purpureocillium lilacinum TaxID=33203 RepID=A0A179HUT2_PURLI|nr:hypothetical protein VFPFJ_00256 [Purpureocillium lilacinum]OAQ94147.1 hypothetical protein VFPFJ_00256 [Purpureocillium lilacinum]